MNVIISTAVSRKNFDVEEYVSVSVFEQKHGYKCRIIKMFHSSPPSLNEDFQGAVNWCEARGYMYHLPIYVRDRLKKSNSELLGKLINATR